MLYASSLLRQTPANKAINNPSLIHVLLIISNIRVDNVEVVIIKRIHA